MGEFLGGFCFPHGAIALDPQTRDFRTVQAIKSTSQSDAIRLHDAMKEQARILMSKNPDLLILSTPHGIRLENAYVFVGNTRACGNAGTYGEGMRDWTNFKANVQIDVGATSILAHELKTLDHAVDMFRIGDPVDDTAPLLWAEVVPLWFIAEAAKELDVEMPPVVFLGQKICCYKDGRPNVQEGLHIGRHMMSILSYHKSFAGRRVAVVISGNLAHTHSEAPSSPIPFHTSSDIFDSWLQSWAKRDITQDSIRRDGNEHALIKEAGTIETTAQSCGYTGYVMLEGMLTEAVKTKRIKGFKASLLKYAAPTYFGMMVNNFIPE